MRGPLAQQDALLLAESTFDVISVHAFDGTILYVSPACRELLGYEPEELLGRGGSLQVHPDDVPIIEQTVQRLLADERDSRNEYRMIHKDGRTVWVETSNRLVTDEASGQQHIVCVTRDITARKTMEEMARTSQERIESAMRGADLGFWNIDLTSGRLVTDDNGAKLLGTTVDHAPATFEQWLEIIHPDDHPPLKQVHDEYRAGTRHDHELELRLRKVTGEWFWILSRGRVVERDAEGHPIRAAGTNLDITSRRRAEEQLAEAKQAAEAASRAKSEFLANVSHEIRTPMTAILGYTNLLMKQTPADHPHQQSLQIVHRNAEALLLLINDILDLSKIEADQLELNLVRCSPWRLVDEVVQLLQIRASDKGLALCVDHGSPVPRHVLTDPIRVRQILVNLLGNAIKFSQRGTIRVGIELVEPPDARPRLAFRVIDEGPGMGADQVDRVFHAFHQADTSHRRRFGGTGLGLAISRRLAHMLGGAISVESELGRGSTFTLTIDPGPLEGVPRDVEPPRATDEATDRSESTPFNLTGRILLAEDARDVRQLIKIVLEQAGLEVDTAENGKVACQAALASRDQGEPYDLILMDVQMPELDGHGAVRRLRAAEWTGPIVALTAHAMPAHRHECEAIGYDDYLPKPVNHETLLSTIATHLRQAPGDQLPRGGTKAPRSSELKQLGLGVLPPEETAALLAAFTAELPQRTQRIAESFQAGDRGSLRAVSHQLKGAASLYGFGNIMDASADICHAIDNQCSAERLGKFVNRLTDLCVAAATGSTNEQRGG